MRRENGSALVLALTFLGLVASLMLANAVWLSHVRRELQRVDRQQRQYWTSWPP